jgi:hypothetical protein
MDLEDACSSGGFGGSFFFFFCHGDIQLKTRGKSQTTI